MNDFLIHFRQPGDARRLESLLRNRPAVAGHRVVTYEFPWGVVAIQPPAARGYAPLHDAAAGTLTAAVGRPRFMGVEHEQRGATGFNLLVREKLDAEGPKAVSDALTGMFALVECSASGVRVMTDPMAFLPVYVGHDYAGRVVAIGTNLEAVAELAGRRTDFDLVSLADLLVSQYVTFPYTTRRGSCRSTRRHWRSSTPGAAPRSGRRTRARPPSGSRANLRPGTCGEAPTWRPSWRRRCGLLPTTSPGGATAWR